MTKKVKRQISTLLLATQLFFSLFAPFTPFLTSPVLANDGEQSQASISTNLEFFSQENGDDYQLHITVQDSSADTVPYNFFYLYEGVLQAVTGELFTNSENVIYIGTQSGDDFIDHDWQQMVFKAEVNGSPRSYRLMKTDDGIDASGWTGEESLDLSFEEQQWLTWAVDQDSRSATTNGKVVLYQEYKFPINEKVSVTFTKLPENSSPLTIREVILSEELAEKYGTDVAYDITTEMENGEFEFDLSLPKPEGLEGDKVEVVYADNEEDLNAGTVQNVEGEVSLEGEEEERVVKVGGLNHMTVYFAVNSMLIAKPLPIQPEIKPVCDITVTQGQSVQEAINKSKESEEKLTICVKQGVYKENLEIRHPVTLQALVGDPQTEEVVIIGNENSAILISNTKQVEINGFTLTESSKEIGALVLEETDDVLIIGNRFINNKIGISVIGGGNNNVKKNIFENNQKQVVIKADQSDRILKTILSQNKFDGAVVVRKKDNLVAPIIFGKIQAAVDSANKESTLDIYNGIYQENVTIDKPLFFNGVEEIRPVIKGGFLINTDGEVIVNRLSFEVADTDKDSIYLEKVGQLDVRDSIFNGSELFVNGGRRGIQSGDLNANVNVEKSVFINGYYTAIQGKYKSLVVNQSTISNCKSGINFQGGSDLSVNNTDISVVAQSDTNDTYAVRFASSSSNSGENMTLNGGIYSVDTNNYSADSNTYHSAIVVRSGAQGVLKANNLILNGDVVNLSALKFDATKNNWGTVDFSEIEQIVYHKVDDPALGLVDFSSPIGLQSDFSSVDTTNIGETITGNFVSGNITIVSPQTSSGTGTMAISKYAGEPDTGALSLGVKGYYYNIEYTGDLNFPITLKLGYRDSDFDENKFVSLYYFDGTEWKDYQKDEPASTVSIDKDNNIITANLQHLTPVVPGVDTVSPLVTIDQQDLITRNTTPTLTGTIDDSGATVVLSLDGTEYSAINNGDGTWKIDLNDSLPDKTYAVTVTATDLADNSSSVVTTLTIDNRMPRCSEQAFSYYENGELLENSFNSCSGQYDPKEVVYVQSLDELSFSAELVDANYSGEDSAAGLDKVRFYVFKMNDNPEGPWDYQQSMCSGTYDEWNGELGGSLKEKDFSACPDLEEGLYRIGHMVHQRETGGVNNPYGDYHGIYFRVDNTAPSSELSVIANHHEAKNRTLDNSWRGFQWFEEFVEVSLHLSGPYEKDDFINYKIVSASENCGDSGYQEYTTNLAEAINNKEDGIYKLCYYAEDLVGNTEDPINEQILKLDKSKGTAEIDSINGQEINGTLYTQSPVNITAKLTDNESGIARTRMYIYKEGVFGTVESVLDDTVFDPGATYTHTSEFNLDDGQYRVRVRGYDKAQNHTNIPTEYFTVDNTAPLVSDISITKNGKTAEFIKTGDEIAISATVVDDLSGVKAVSADFSFNSTYNDRPSPQNRSMKQVGDTDNYEVTYTVPEGWNQNSIFVTVAARDNLDNYTANRDLAKEIVVDNEAPLVAITSPSENDWLRDSVDILGTVTDNIELSHYNISVYPGDADYMDFSKRLLQNTEYLKEGFSTENLLLTWDTADGNFEDGEYLIRLAARDAAGNRDLNNSESGNTSSQHVITVLVDNTAPFSTISTYELNNGESTYINKWQETIEGTATDNL
ncbi:MAG: Thrombospondin type 3 repeat family, partial [Microgenomates bacterium 39_7]